MYDIMRRSVAAICAAFAILLAACSAPGAGIEPAALPSIAPAPAPNGTTSLPAFSAASVRISEFAVPAVDGFIAWPTAIDIAGDGAVYFGRGVGCCFGSGATPGLFRYVGGRFGETRGYFVGSQWDGGGLVDAVDAHDAPRVMWSSPYLPYGSPLSDDFLECGSGEIAAMCPSLEGPLGAAVYSILTDPAGNVWIAGESCCNGNLGGAFGYPAQLPSNLATVSAFSLTLASGPDRHVWGALTGQAGPIYEFGDGGAVLRQFNLPAGTVLPPTPGDDVVIEGRDGAMWFVDEGHNAIWRMTTAGRFSEYRVPTPDSGLAGIALAPDGGMWFTEANANKIGRIDVSGAIQEFAVPTPNAGLGAIAAPAKGSPCNPSQVWFTEMYAEKIASITY